MKHIVGYKVEVSVDPAPSMVQKTEEQLLARAREAAGRFISLAEQHIDDVNPKYPLTFQDIYRTSIVPVYGDEEGAK